MKVDIIWKLNSVPSPTFCAPCRLYYTAEQDYKARFSHSGQIIIAPSSKSLLFPSCLSLYQGYSLPTVYTDRSGSTDSMSVTIYPQDPDSFPQAAGNGNLGTSSSQEANRHDCLPTNDQSPPKCNGSMGNGTSDVHSTIYPSNHDRMAATSLSKSLQVDGKGVYCFHLSQGYFPQYILKM